MAKILNLRSLLLDREQTPGSSGSDSMPRTHVVVLDHVPAPADLATTVAGLLQQLPEDHKPRQLFEQLGAFSVDLSAAQAVRLQHLPGVRSVEADRLVPLLPPVAARPSLVESDDTTPVELAGRLLWNGRFRSDYATNTAYSLDDTGLQAASYGDVTSASGETLPWGVKAVWNGLDVSSRGNIGSGNTVFVIDSGVLDSTGDLNLNSAWSRSWIAGASPFTDGNGHGTHVAGTIAALANGKGVVGVAPGAQVVSLKVFDSTGGGASISSIIDAINYAVLVITSQGLDRSKVVINMSLGGGLSSSLTNAVLNAANQGIRFCIAAGNSGQDVDDFSPANAGHHANVYTVSAVDSAYRMPSWSNWDRISSRDAFDTVDLAAPGVGVLSYYQGGQLAYLSGTSMAAPHVAGLLLSGGAAAGSLVTPAFTGTADPLALAAETTGAPAPTYSLTAAASVDEGSTLQITVNTTNVAMGTVLTLQFAGNGISADELGLASLLSQVSIDASGRGSFTATVKADRLTEGNESLQVALFNNGALSTPLAQATVVLNDTSLTAPSSGSGDQVLWGTIQADTIVGGSGNDRLTGVLASGLTAIALGAGQVDLLTGGAGADVFVLGDQRGIFYNDTISSDLGRRDYAQISDFRSGVDKVQLASAFYLTAVNNGTTSLYWDRTGNGQLNTSGIRTDELIAVFSNATLASGDLVWV